MTKHPRHKAFSILSQILWERRFKKRKLTPTKMTETEFERCKGIIEEIKKEKINYDKSINA